MRELLATLAYPLRVLSLDGFVLWQNQAAEALDGDGVWERQPVAWQDRKAILATMGLSAVDHGLEIEQLREDNERLRRQQRNTARRKKKAESQALASEKASSTFERKERELREAIEATQRRVEELEAEVTYERGLSQDLRQKLDFAESLEHGEQEALQESLRRTQEELAKVREEHEQLIEETRLAETQRALEEQLALKIREIETLEQTFENEQREFLLQKQELHTRLSEQESEFHELYGQLKSPGKSLEPGGDVERFEKLKADLEQARHEISDATHREIRLTEKLDAAEELRIEQAKLLSVVRGELEELRSREEVWRQKSELVDGLRQELDRARNEALVSLGEARGLREAVGKLEASLSESQQEVAKSRLLAPASGLSLRRSSPPSGDEGAPTTVKSQLDLAQSRLRETEKRLDQTKEELKKAQAEAESSKVTEKLAFQDPLTGLPNRHMVARYLDYSHRLMLAHQRVYAFFLIELDQFDSINAVLGQETGDRLLKACGERLVAMQGENYLVARYDETRFALLATQLDRRNVESFIRDASRVLRDALERPFDLQGDAVCFRCVLGIAIGPSGEPGETFLRAEQALVCAKARGRQDPYVFDEALRTKLGQQATYARQLDQAIERLEIRAVYQPIFHLVRGRILGAELLLRWHHRDQRVLLPDDFLSPLIESGQIFSLWEKVWPKAFRALLRWRRRRPEMTLSINLSDRELLSPHLVERALSWTRAAATPASSVIFEVRDASLLRSSTLWRKVIDELYSAGFGLALDDYATPSSLWDTLSIPGFCQAKMIVDEKNPICLPAVGAGRELLYCAKFLQTKFEPKALRKAGFGLAQGFAVARPLEEDDFDGVLT